ncbi:hypothetical protein JHK86_006495 [Glycine max]|nr:hypothetical protein JHK86_006495 [Glycine max]
MEFCGLQPEAIGLQSLRPGIHGQGTSQAILDSTGSLAEFACEVEITELKVVGDFVSSVPGIKMGTMLQRLNGYKIYSHQKEQVKERLFHANYYNSHCLADPSGLNNEIFDCPSRNGDSNTNNLDATTSSPKLHFSSAVHSPNKYSTWHLNFRPVLPALAKVTKKEEGLTSLQKIVIGDVCSILTMFLIVGGDPVLGSWDPLEALPMTWSEGHVWAVELDMPAGQSFQYKFILKGEGGDIIWQPGSDRLIHTWETMNRIVVLEDWENVELQKITEEDQLAEPIEEPQVDFEVPTLAEFLNNPQELDSKASEISSVEDTQIHAVDEPLAETVGQQITGNSISSSMVIVCSIVVENISSSEDLISSISHKSNKKSILRPSEESADSPGNDDIIHDLGHNGNAASLENQEKTIVESSLFDLEEGPVLVPGLTIPPTEPTDEADQGEVQESTKKDISVEAFETQDQNIAEFSKEEETDDAIPQEINATINNEPELLYNKHEESHLSPEMEDGQTTSQMMTIPCKMTSNGAKTR